MRLPFTNLPLIDTSDFVYQYLFDNASKIEIPVIIPEDLVLICTSIEQFLYSVLQTRGIRDGITTTTLFANVRLAKLDHS